MMPNDLDDWLNDLSPPAEENKPPSLLEMPNPEIKKSAPLATGKLGRGGVIRNSTTKRVSQTNNPVNTPKPPSRQGKGGTEPTPEQEARALNPALAFPSVLIGMDVDVDKRVAESAPKLTETPGFSYSTTIGQLLQQAHQSGGKIDVGNEIFQLSIQIKNPDAIRPRTS
jgi:hypothetical protein